MDSNEYLEESARTAANPEGTNLKDLFAGQPAGLLYELVDCAVMGAKCDAIKRSVFYKTGQDKLDEKLREATELHTMFYKDLKGLKGAEITLSDTEIDMLHAILGLQSEVGEFIDGFIKAKLEGKEMNHDLPD